MISKYIRELVAHQDYSDEHNCIKFAQELKHLAELECERLPLMVINFKDKMDCDHMANYYEENGIWFFEPQSGKNKILDFSDVHFIQLEFPFQDFYCFTWDEKDGWSPAVFEGELKAFNL